jgi:hypothetical protein
VEGANQEVLHHLHKWSFEQLPLVQRIMNTVEKASTGVTQLQSAFHPTS